ncbi:NADH-quinone oxidoreductase subunit NuoI, partial [Actinomyces bowdenii]|nr:NADH-quinone oxidoreductase subunit NuoI [Actinomyces bowdenii]NYS70515.1 NADH-quinone oxidoreductase subunit NuoI [Actinomyces bowdenii]
PHPMVAGTEDGDYYRGAVTGPTRDQIEWVRAHRPEDPTLDTARPVPGPTSHPVEEALR